MVKDLIVMLRWWGWRQTAAKRKRRKTGINNRSCVKSDITVFEVKGILFKFHLGIPSLNTRQSHSSEVRQFCLCMKCGRQALSAQVTIALVNIATEGISVNKRIQATQNICLLPLQHGSQL